MTDATGKSIGRQPGTGSAPYTRQPVEREPAPARPRSPSRGPFGAVAEFAARYAWVTAVFSIVLIMLVALAISLHPIDLDRVLETAGRVVVRDGRSDEKKGPKEKVPHGGVSLCVQPGR